MAGFQVLILQFLQLNHILLCLCMFTSFLSPWGHGFLFSVSCPPPHAPLSLQSFPLFVGFPWPTNKSSGRGTVEPLTAPVWSSFCWPQCSHSPLVCMWLSRRKKRKRGKWGQKLFEKEMELLNKTAVRKSRDMNTFLSFCVVTKLPPLIPFTISAALRHLMAIRSEDFHPQVQFSSCSYENSIQLVPLPSSETPFLCFQSPNLHFLTPPPPS